MKNKYLFRLAFGRKARYRYLMKGEGSKEMVGNTPIAAYEELELQSWVIDASDPKKSYSKVRFVGRFGVAEKVISPRVISFDREIGRGSNQRYVSVQDAVIFPFEYNDIMTTYKAQSRQFKFMHAHLGSLRGKDNQAISEKRNADPPGLTP